jgi:hypothetical protein
MSMQAGVLGCSVLAAGLLWASVTLGQGAGTPGSYDIVDPPTCSNHQGETVRFVDRGAGDGSVAAGMAVRDSDGAPTVFRSNYAASPPEFQRFIDRHECAHHQTGDVDRPHPPRNGPEHLMNESVSDCIAILRLRDEEGYDEAVLGAVTDAMQADMESIGFPEISITSRISNVSNCFVRDGSSADLINKVLEQRGLLTP